MKKRFLSFGLAVVLSLLLLPAMAARAAEPEFEIHPAGWLMSYNGPGGNVVIPENVTAIMGSVFAGKANVTGVTIPNGVKAIEASAFADCTGLTNIVMPDTVTFLGDNAFSGCKNLTDATLSKGLKSISSGTFSGCEALTAVVIPDNVTSIGDNAFSGCERLAAITLSEGLKSISSGAFSGCEALTAIVIPENVTSIGNNAFSGCKNLTGVTLSKGLKSISSGAFSGCEALTAVVIPENVTFIGDNAFSGCTGLNSVTVGAYTGSAFQVCPNLKTVIYRDGTTTTGNDAFFGCQSVTAVVFPDSMREIGENAFRKTGLTEVSLPDSVTAIGEYAFADCAGLTSLTIGRGVTAIAASAFQDCPQLRSATDRSAAGVWNKTFFDIQNRVLTKYKGPERVVTVPDGVTAIGEGAFSGCKNLTEVVLPDSVTSINANAFKSCYSLESITLSNNVTSIGDAAFYGCISLTGVRLPNSVTSIGARAFYGCSSLETFIWPKQVTEIKAGTFAWCTKLTNVTLHSGVTAVGGYAFLGCILLKELSYSKELENVDVTAFIDTPVNTSDRTLRELMYEGGYTEWINLGKQVKEQSDRIQALSDEITQNAGTDYEKARAVYFWMQKNIAYDYDYLDERKSEVAIEPEEVLDSRCTICDGYARLTQALLQAQGIPTLYVVGFAGTEGPGAAHAWNEVFVGDRWVTVDTTWSRGAYTRTNGSAWKARSEYFDIPAALLAKERCVYKYGDIGGILNFFFDASEYTPYALAKDTPSDWAQREVWTAMVGRIIPNDLQGAYESDITREEFCRTLITMLERKVGSTMADYLAAEGLTAEAPFTDTEEPAVLAAYALGIIKGKSATIFDPKGSITRQEAAIMLSQAAKKLGLTTGEGESFRDADTIAPWAADSVAFISGLVDPTIQGKVMGSTGGNRFSPEDPYTREQAFASILRLYHCATQ